MRWELSFCVDSATSLQKMKNFKDWEIFWGLYLVWKKTLDLEVEQLWFRHMFLLVAPLSGLAVFGSGAGLNCLWNCGWGFFETTLLLRIEEQLLGTLLPSVQLCCCLCAYAALDGVQLVLCSAMFNSPSHVSLPLILLLLWLKFEPRNPHINLDVAMAQCWNVMLCPVVSSVYYNVTHNFQSVSCMASFPSFVSLEEPGQMDGTALIH